MVLIVFFASLTIIGWTGTGAMLWLDRKPIHQLNTPVKRVLGNPSMDFPEAGAFLFCGFLLMANMAFGLICAIAIYHDPVNFSWF